MSDGKLFNGLSDKSLKDKKTKKIMIINIDTDTETTK